MPFVPFYKQKDYTFQFPVQVRCLRMIFNIFYNVKAGLFGQRLLPCTVPGKQDSTRVENGNFNTSKLHGVVFFFVLVLILPGYGCRNDQKTVAYGKNSKTGNYADINGIKMYYELYGQGEPLILIHGNGGSISAGREQIAFFSKHYKVIAVDSRGQGKTIDNGDSLTYDTMAADINGLLDHLHLDSTYVIGQSDGAIIGLITAYRYPKKVKMLAAMAPNTRPDSAVFYPAVEEQDEKELTQFEDSLKAGFKEVKAKLKLLRLMKYHPHISTAELASIKAPVMIMSGDRDLIMLSHIIEIFRAIPKSNLCVLPGSTHFALRKNPDVFNETIYRFFTRPFIMPDSY